MWKKDEETPAERTTDAGDPEAPAPEGRAGSAAPATIGPSITITGDVEGEEDLVIQGRIDGSVNLKNQAVTVGRQGRVEADIVGRVVTVEGEVEGDLTADEQVILRSAAHVEGDITAPRVVLEDGANFKGLVDMSNPASGGGRPGGRTSRQASSSTSKQGGGEGGSSSESSSSTSASASGDRSSSGSSSRKEKTTT